MENTNQPKMDSLYGKIYPFYLENNRLSNYLAYQVYSPSVDESITPYFSLKLISENLPFNSKKDKVPTREELMRYQFNDLRIFNYAVKDSESVTGNELDDISLNTVNDMLKKFKADSALNFDVYQDKPGEFPRFSICKHTNDPQKSLIIYLRNSIRWTRYKFAPGSLVDVLWTLDSFVVFKIEGTETEMWLTPQAMYKLSDFDQKNPMSVKNINFTTETFSRDKSKITDFNNAIKLMEWKSFDRK